MMAEHTPGPWRIGSGQGHFQGWRTHVESEVGTIAWVELDEDALVIAAAPDMYEALKAVVGATSRYELNEDAMPRVRAAIARAEGRTTQNDGSAS